MFGKRHPLVELMHEEHKISSGPSIPSSFDSLMQAKSYLDILASGVFRLRGDLLMLAKDQSTLLGALPSDNVQCECYLLALSRSVDLGSKQCRILSRKETLEAGLFVFWKALGGLAETLKTSQNRALMAIQIQYLAVSFTVTTCRDTHESICDKFDDCFESAIQTAERYIKSLPTFNDLSQKRSLSLEPGMIPTIHLVAQRCRIPELRSKAIALLHEGCAQEAMWDGMPFATFMRKVADLEEAVYMRDIDSCGRANTGHNVPGGHYVTIPEHARFIDIVIADDLDDLGMGRIACARYRHESDGQIELSEYTIALGV